MNKETELSNAIKNFEKKMKKTKCQCCNKTPLTDTFGEWYKNKWWCFEHTEILFSNENVENLSGLWEKS